LCHQSVGLIQSVIEKAGIPTVSITLLREVTERVAPPRALFVDRPLGFPLGESGNRRLQTDIIIAALRMLSTAASRPLLYEFAEMPSGQQDRRPGDGFD
jgi:D-proline reductase (dithiol) PrdB